MFELKDSAVAADQRMQGYMGLRAAQEARLVEYLDLEGLDNHESFGRPAFAWKDAEDEVAPEPEGETWWVDPRDKGDELADCLVGIEALDARLSQEMAKTRRTKREETRVQWSTDKVARTFFQVRTQRDLDEAFVFLCRVEDRRHIAQGVIQAAVDRVVRLEREARQARIDGLRELNARMGEWARSISYRVRLHGERKPVTRQVRDQSWVLVELRPGIGQVCRGKNAGSKTVLVCEPEIFGFMKSQTAA